MLLDGESTLTDVTSVWISILILWFPLEEEYQLRIKPNTNWIEIYVMRVAQRPRDEDQLHPSFRDSLLWRERNQWIPRLECRHGRDNPPV